MLQKVLKIGNSLGTTFPKSFVAKNGIKPGMVVKVNEAGEMITYSTKIPKHTTYQAVDDDEFLMAVNEVQEKYGQALEDLADK